MLLRRPVTRKLIMRVRRHPRIHLAVRKIYFFIRRSTKIGSAQQLYPNPGPWQIKRNQNRNLVTIVTRDIPMYDRAGSYLRLHEIILLLQILNFKVRILSLNTIDRQRSLWELEMEDIYEYQNIYRNLNVEVLTGGIQSLNICQSNVSEQHIFWLHEVGVAFDFLDHFRGKIPFQKLFLDTVDLEYRRHFQMGAVRMADESVKKLVALSKYADKTILITNEEKTLHSQLVRNENVKNYVLSNIYEEFKPFLQAKSLDSKYELLFVGNFLHLPNIDALDFLLDSIISELGGIRIGVVGPNLPIDYVNKINSYKEHDVSYLGQVRDISSIYQVSKVVIAPLRVGAGVKGKVLEALQHGKTVVGTSIAWEGIPDLNASVKYEANSGPEFASAIKMALSNDAVLNEQDCQLLNSVFSRKKNLENLMEIMEIQ